MYTILKKLKTRASLEWCLDTLSLFSVLQYCAYRFLQSTMFNFYYSQRYKLITMGLLLVFGGIRYLYIVINKLKGYGEKNDRIKFILQCGGAWLLALPFFYVGWLHDYKNLIFLPICCLCLYDMEAEKVCKSFVATISICLLATILCCLSGTVRNLVSTDTNYVSAYGIINSTDFASYFSFLLLALWCGIRLEKKFESLLFVLFILIITYGVYRVTESRTLLFTGGLTSLFVLWNCLEKYVSSSQKWLRPFRKLVKWISILAFPIIGGLVTYFTMQYAAGETWAVQLNTILSGRLSTVLSPYRIYGITQFGNTIENLHGQGGTILGKFWSGGYGYLDVAYAMLAIKYGWIVTVIVSGIWIWMTVKAFKTGKNKIGYALAIMAVHAFSEARILDVNYNILLIMPFCSFAFQNRSEESVLPDKKRIYQPLLVGILIAAISWLILPRGLSWLRTFFYLEEWNYGTASFRSLLFCAAIILFLLLLWRIGISCGGKHNNKKLWIPLVGLFIILIAGLITINNTIEKGCRDQANRLRTEEQVIQSIQESATMPIYAADLEELYRRSGVKLSKRLFSVEELVRNKGTIIVNSNENVPSIILSGGLYAQISDQTGMYTYDPSVIDRLKQLGYQISRSFTGAKHCNLRDLALYNNIKMEDYLRINSQRVITSNAEADQLFGKYEVIFSFSDLSANTVGDVILLEVLGEHGERIIQQEVLKAIDFDTAGSCQCTLSYQTQSTPCVSYAITAKEGVSVTIDSISWKRIPSKVSNEETSDDQLIIEVSKDSYHVKSEDYLDTVIFEAYLPKGTYIISCRQDQNLSSVIRNRFFYSANGNKVYEPYDYLLSGLHSWNFTLNEDTEVRISYWLVEPSCEVTVSDFLLQREDS